MEACRGAEIPEIDECHPDDNGSGDGEGSGAVSLGGGFTEDIDLVACLGSPQGWVRPFGNVPISAAGAVDCKAKCLDAGYAYFGLECPMTTEVHCQCSNNLDATTEYSKEYCEGKGAPVHHHCVGQVWCVWLPLFKFIAKALSSNQRT